jgi:hypothetical protein
LNVTAVVKFWKAEFPDRSKEADPGVRLVLPPEVGTSKVAVPRFVAKESKLDRI